VMFSAAIIASAISEYAGLVNKLTKTVNSEASPLSANAAAISTTFGAGGTSVLSMTCITPLLFSMSTALIFVNPLISTSLLNR